MSDMDLEKAPQTPQTYGRHQAPAEYEPGEGCLTTAIRIPVRIVVLVVVVPVRMVWDLLVVCGRAADRLVLRPLGRALAWVYENVLAPVGIFIGKALFVWPWVALWRYVIVPVVTYGLVVPVVWIYRQLLTPLGHGIAWLLTAVGHGIAWLVEHLLVAPARWVYRRLLTPVGHGIAAVLGWLGKALFVWPWVALWRYVIVPVVTYGLVVPVVWIYRQLLTPLGHGIAWLLTAIGHGIAVAARAVWTAVVWTVVTLLVTPLVWVIMNLLVAPVAWLYRHVLAPVGREIAAAVGVAWRIAGYISRAVGRGIKWLAWNLVGRPVRWFYQSVCTPVGHAVRDGIWRPAKRAAIEAGRAAGSAIRSARETVRQARRDAWRALVGGPPAAKTVDPLVRQARTLGSTTTVPGVAAEPEISLHKQG
ncbi:hypothetical protein [Streptomyces sp. NPDC020681]|uniref:hypothetical protein n=1 Tax=Streptomyces sp. NPDC020681 TaxID=3365083 RepID=UPI003799D2E7